LFRAIARSHATRRAAFDFQLAGQILAPRDTACAAIFRVEVYGLRGFASSLPRACSAEIAQARQRQRWRRWRRLEKARERKKDEV
jgi:hypothetical protein